MNNIKEVLNEILKENSDRNAQYQRNLLKDYLQIFVLDYVYSSKKYNNLIFYGGSALAQCYGLPRLSEDLDFVDIDKKININALAVDLGNYFFDKTDLKPIVKVQKFRIYFKFPILKEIGLSGGGETDMLYLKIEIFKEFDFCDKYKIEIKPIFKLNKSILIKTFDLPTLMSTKIRAVFKRKWEKTSKGGKTIVSVKGRDYFDLMWYLEKGIKPNLACLEYDSLPALKKDLARSVEKADSKSIQLDLNNFIADKNFVLDLSKSIKEIIIKGITNL